MNYYKCPCCEGKKKIIYNNREQACGVCGGEGIMTETEIRIYFGQIHADKYMKDNEVGE